MGNSISDRPIHRVDKFSVPTSARHEFLERVGAMHVFLRTLPGFVHDAVLEQTEGPARFNFVTIVTWADQHAVDAARVLVSARNRESGVNPHDVLSKLGVAADIGFYRDVAEDASARPFQHRR
jgi:hypothetical protein